MDTWDSLYPFTADEAKLFSRLHQKATKFPAPLGIKIEKYNTEKEESLDIDKTAKSKSEEKSTKINFDDEQTKQYSQCIQLNSLKSHFERSQNLVRSLDLLLEAHKQLTLVTTEHSETCPSLQTSERSVSPTQSQPNYKVNDECEIKLKQVQENIKLIESYNQSLKYLQNCSIPSVSTSPAFYLALKNIIFTSSSAQISWPVPAQIISRVCGLMEKCWDNGLVAMERVLERDLVSLEAYLDDRVYHEIRDQVIKRLISLTKLQGQDCNFFTELIFHFLASYTKLRQNLITIILDQRLNIQFCDSSPKDQVLHLIERTRLLMVVEKREFNFIFDYDFNDNNCVNLDINDIQKAETLNIEPEIIDVHNTNTDARTIDARILSSHLNKILETVGNLLFSRIEYPCRALNPEESNEISIFVYPLMKSILSEDRNSKDPFGLFLQLLVQKFFPISPVDITQIAIKKQHSNDQIFIV